MTTEPYIEKRDISKVNVRKNSKPFLGKLDIELTERSNNNCVHCCINLPADDLEAKKKERFF